MNNLTSERHWTRVSFYKIVMALRMHIANFRLVSLVSKTMPSTVTHFRSWQASGIQKIQFGSMLALICSYVFYKRWLYQHMSECENPRFTERTFTNLGRSHRLPHVCTIMIYGKLGGYRLQETAVFIYIYDELWIICDIWVSLMWILEKYDDITLKRGYR